MDLVWNVNNRFLSVLFIELRKTKKNEEKIEYYARMYLKSQIEKIEKILDTSFNASVSSLVEYLFLKNTLEELKEDYEMIKKRGKR